MICEVKQELIKSPESVKIGFRTNSGEISLHIVDLLKACPRYAIRKLQSYLHCETAIKVSNGPPTIGLPLFYSNVVTIEKQRQTLGIYSKYDSENPMKGAHLLGIMYSTTESELEYLIYVLFGIDAFLLTIISGYLWNKRHDIVQMGVNNFLNG